MIWQIRAALVLLVAGLVIDSALLMTGRDLVHILDDRAGTFAALQLAAAAVILIAARREIVLGEFRADIWPSQAGVPWLYAVHLTWLTLLKLATGFQGSASLPETGSVPYWLYLIAFWLTGWAIVRLLAGLRPAGPAGRRAVGLAAPLIFGATLLVIWEKVVHGANISPVLLPAPSRIFWRMTMEVPTLWADFLQTFVKGALAGYALGCGAAFLTALAIDRSPFLQRGLLPVGNLVAALPVIGIAPIMVMWFGFDWQSKAAVVVVMVFFPMLVNTVEGLRAADPLSRDLMRTYAAGYGQTLAKLRLPAAAPFIFNGLKISSTLALIGAIVAEFFGTPIVGMGFRISTEVGRMNLDMVWATIAVAGVAGSLFYGAVVLVERAATFWHPSVRGGR